jgi:hypothetical protein
MEAYEALPEEERLEKYREEIRDAEKKMLIQSPSSTDSMTTSRL